MASPAGDATAAAAVATEPVHHPSVSVPALAAEAPESAPEKAPQHTTIYVIRHGRTEWNTDNRLQGWADVALDAHGIAQAAATGRALQHVRHLKAVYSSDLKRAHVTASEIAKHHGLSVVPDERLREHGWGVFQGLTWDQVSEKHHDAMIQYRCNHEFVVPEGESSQQVHLRVKAVMHEIATRHVGETVAVAAHGGVLAHIWRLAHKLALSDKTTMPARPNCAINVLQYSPTEGWTVLVWGDLSHLDDIPAAGAVGHHHHHHHHK